MPPTPAAPVQPNHFELSGPHHHGHHGGGHIHVSYTTHSGLSTPEFPQGPPQFSYQDASQSHAFSGKQIQIVDTEAGQIVSVVLRLTPDSGSTTFSLLVPRVNLPDGHPTPISTDGITAIHRFSIAPGLLQGQLDHYSVTPLHGTASSIIVPL
jgi:hypothetical protein